ncbi:DUF4197 domain-containing protein [Marinoscillum furvescens]|uniref:Uncharacterized protein DUF4197 n=1 Tax=Marinoscillum furvescens DSM 4134 TaxID=1122208 RepID=A0A3D9L6V4_MARFU|nr:DUF4197 domain-containing protein [Marinoscillum furvescens]REE02078.1 uncharacterized protein DUF4197 [Marinoscillum furvescens DSM 4134]
MRLVSFILVLIMISACTVQQIQQTLDDYLDSEQLTTEQVAAGLKQALEVGISKGANNAAQLDGYWKNPAIRIPFPPDVVKVENKLRDIGLGAQVDKFLKTLNRGAEEAAKEAKPIIVSAIRSMTIQDAWNILKGSDDAATQYLKQKTSDQLRARFKPVISQALKKTNATKYYSDIVETYNKIPFTDDVDPDLENYATSQALDGLFKLVAEEEKKIRQDPVARTTELLKKVFAQQD